MITIPNTAFEGFPKIARLNREIVVTEKIDGTNAQISVDVIEDYPDCEDKTIIASEQIEPAVHPGPLFRVLRAGSRSRWLTRQADNFGFAKWVDDNQSDLFNLGPGRHFGEWWGSGIQRGYGLVNGDKRFSLFNTGRWAPSWNSNACRLLKTETQEYAPECCHVVPVLAIGTLAVVDWCVQNLREQGSFAAPGFMKPEGVVVYHTAARQLFKVTLENDEMPKGAQ